jgi:Mrp family chromosome partitioning ATPase/capsular polysaccharide biosynthesis protein
VEHNPESASSGAPTGLDGDSTWVGPGLVGSLRRYWFVIVAVTASAAIAGLAVSLLMTPRYEAQASLYLRDPGSPGVLALSGSAQSQSSGDHGIFMTTQAGVAGSDVVLDRALQSLKRGGTPAEVRRSVVVAPSADLASISIQAAAGDPVEAADLANAVGTAYEQVARERVNADSKAAIAGLEQVLGQRSDEFDALRAQIARASRSDQENLGRKAQHVADLIGALQVHEDEIAAQAAVYGSGVESFEKAVPPVSSSQPGPLLLALLGAAIGFVAAGGWAWWAAGRNPRVDAEGDAGAILGVPLLGKTPRLGVTSGEAGGSSSPLDDVDPVAAEAYHFVLVSLEHALSGMGGKIVAVVSAGQGDGKTVTVLNLALAARREGRKMLLVDADERTRRLSQLCRNGELDVTGRSHDGDGCPTGTDSGTVLQAGPSERNGHHPAVFFRSTAFDRMISLSGEPFDLVLIDTPALLGVSETVTIAEHADAVLLVVNRGTSVADLRRAGERLGFTDTPVIGYVLNRAFAQRADGDGDGAGWASLARSLLRRHGVGALRRQARPG